MRKNLLRVWIRRAFNGLMDDVLDLEGRNITRARQRLALEQTVEFIEDNLPATISFDNRYSLLKHLVRFIPSTENGLLCEFGVAGGKSINFLSKLMPDRILHGFDSFEGLPEDWSSRLPKGAFKQAMPKVEANVRLYKGWFSDTLPPFLAEHTGKADFLNIDCDLYSSTKTVLGLFAPRIQPGTIVYFDEFFNYAGWKEGEFKAFMEFIKTSGMDFEYLGYNSRGTQLAVKMKS